jgi:hypothetical protein
MFSNRRLSIHATSIVGCSRLITARCPTKTLKEQMLIEEDADQEAGPFQGIGIPVL